MLGNKTIRSLGPALGNNLKKELKDQGHYLTGALDESIDPKYSNQANGVSLDIVALEYINQLNTGIPGYQIDESDPEYIAGLAEYAKLRWNLTTERQQLRAALAIAKAHRREGMPTQNSYNYSSTGERTEAIETSYNEHEKEYNQIFDNSFSSELDALIDQTFDQTIF